MHKRYHSKKERTS